MTASAFWHNFDRNAKAFWHKFGHHTDGEKLNLTVETLGKRRHWLVLLKVLLPTVGFLIAAVWLSLLVSGTSWSGVQWFLWCGVAGAVLYSAWGVLEWRHEILYVDNMRFIVAKRLIARAHNVTPIDTLNHFTWKPTVVGRLLHYGTLNVYSAGHREEIEYVPEEISRAINARRFGTDRRSWPASGQVSTDPRDHSADFREPPRGLIDGEDGRM